MSLYNTFPISSASKKKMKKGSVSDFFLVRRGDIISSLRVSAAGQNYPRESSGEVIVSPAELCHTMAVKSMKALSSRPFLTGLGLGLLTLCMAGIKMKKKNKLPNLGVVPTAGKRKAWIGDGYRGKGEWRWLRKTST
jgi:hypothetical protein